MKKDKVKQLIKIISAVWAVIALIIFGLAMGKVISLDTFQSVFAGGFLIWVVVVTVASQTLFTKQD